MSLFFSPEEVERMEEETRIVEEHEKMLLANGHTCVLTIECYPPELDWCGQTPCANTKGGRKTPCTPPEK